MLVWQLSAVPETGRSHGGRQGEQEWKRTSSKNSEHWNSGVSGPNDLAKHSSGHWATSSFVSGQLSRTMMPATPEGTGIPLPSTVFAGVVEMVPVGV